MTSKWHWNGFNPAAAASFRCAIEMNQWIFPCSCLPCGIVFLMGNDIAGCKITSALEVRDSPPEHTEISDSGLQEKLNRSWKWRRVLCGHRKRWHLFLLNPNLNLYQYLYLYLLHSCILTYCLCLTCSPVVPSLVWLFRLPSCYQLVSCQ